MAQIPQISTDLMVANPGLELDFQLPDPTDEEISDTEFQQQVDAAWLVCDRVDLQSEIWRGRILRTVRDREKRGGDGRGSGFLNWLKDRELSKSRAYSLIELANSADSLLEQGYLDPGDFNHFSKRAFVETAQAAPEVQQLVSDAARENQHITRREVRQLADEWTAMTSDLLPEPIKEKAADNTIPPRYVAPFVRELEKLPPAHQTTIQAEVVENPDLDTLKQVTGAARSLAKYLDAANQVQALNRNDLDLEQALEEAVRLDSLKLAADLVNHAAQIEQSTAKLYASWKRLGNLADRLYVDSGASTPQLRLLLDCLASLSGEIIEVQLGDEESSFARTMRLKVLSEAEG